MFYYIFALGTILLSFLVTRLVQEFALHNKIVDLPDQARKKHEHPVPLLGGIGIFISLAVALYGGRVIILSGNLEPRHWYGVLIGAFIIVIGGIIDDIKKLKPIQQFCFAVAAVIAVVIGGVGIAKVTDPYGGLFYLSSWMIPVFSMLWILGMMYTTKLLDGVDGLVSSVGAVGGIVIFLFTSTTRWLQPDIAFAALMFSSACLGFLLLNWPPAKIFLGESGSLLVGFVLGVLSIISGGKIAIALLIMGIPILDVAWTIVRRIIARQNPFKTADRKHLHFRLLDAGLGQRTTVILYASVSLLFGLSTLFLQSRGKFLSLIVLGSLMALLIIVVNWLDRRAKLR